MRQGQNQKRSRGRGRKPQNPLSRSMESNGPDVKIRGTANHIYEKYLNLARDAQSAGDRIAAESYFQHAEHYHRLIQTAQEQRQEQQQNRQQNGADRNRSSDAGDGEASEAPEATAEETPAAEAEASDESKSDDAPAPRRRAPRRRRAPKSDDKAAGDAKPAAENAEA